MESSSQVYGHSEESGWTMYIGSPTQDGDDKTRSDNDDDNDNDNDDDSDDSMASDASSGPPSHHGKPFGNKDLPTTTTTSTAGTGRDVAVIKRDVAINGRNVAVNGRDVGADYRKKARCEKSLTMEKEKGVGEDERRRKEEMVMFNMDGRRSNSSYSTNVLAQGGGSNKVKNNVLRSQRG